jgi:hypothetical protein
MEWTLTGTSWRELWLAQNFVHLAEYGCCAASAGNAKPPPTFLSPGARTMNTLSISHESMTKQIQAVSGVLASSGIKSNLLDLAARCIKAAHEASSDTTLTHTPAAPEAGGGARLPNAELVQSMVGLLQPNQSNKRNS